MEVIMKRLMCIIGGVMLGGILLAQVQDTSIYALQFERDAENNSLWVGQTVRVNGIVTGLTGITGSRNIFIEMKQAGPWTGIMVYFPSGLGTLPPISIGDSVTVTAGVLEYYGNTELQVNAMSDFAVVSNLPPLEPSVITCAHLDTTGTSEFPVDSAEAYEGVLVKIENAYITRTNLGSNNEFEITDGTGYVVVRNNYSYTPTVGDAMNVTGIVEARSLSGTVYYMLRPRSVEDFEFLFPGIADAYSVDRNQVYIKFKTPVDPALATNTTYYVIEDSATGNPLSVISASVSPDDPNLVFLTTGEMTDAAYYKLYTPDLEDIYNQPIADTFYFYGGFVPITLIESDTMPNDADNGFRSIWNGRSVTITGIITAWKDIFIYPFFFIQQGEGPWTGIHGWDPVSFIPSDAIQQGDSVILVGEVLEYGSNSITEIQNFKYYRVVSSGHVVNPVTVPLVDLRNEAGAVSEQWEHVLVAVQPPVFVYDIGTGGDWDIYTAIPPDTFVLTVEGDYALGYTWRPTVTHQQIDGLVGLLRYRGTLYPRTDADIIPSSVRENRVNLGNSLVKGTLSFTVPVNAKEVKVELFNVQGQKVASLYNGKGTGETYNADLSNLPYGAYFIRTYADNSVTTKKIILVK